MKDLKNLTGAKILSKNEQRSIKGGVACDADNPCLPHAYCCYLSAIEGFCRLHWQTC